VGDNLWFLCVFLQTLGAIFARIFDKSKLLGCACTTTSYTTETNQWMKKATTMSNDREGNI